jgi:hypothetical protein
METVNGLPHAVQVIVCPAYCGTCWGVSSYVCPQCVQAIVVVGTILPVWGRM